ncbi:MAG: 2-oxo acid dehydrogenase subunit E2 [Verrucomicrobia bacterium]|nr:2-oxo acid dehydrogenase subunit E2 [Verrucomicrobiota bacterium]
MATVIRMPDFGTTVEQVKLIRWLKNMGATVKRGDVLCEVETDKAVSELESVAEGILLKHVVPEGADVEKGTIIAYVGTPGESLPLTDQPAPVVAPTQAAIPPPAVVVPSLSPSGSTQAAPMIRNLAKSLGVDLQRVTGTGPGGRILREDVHKAKQAIASAGAAVHPPLPSVGTSLSAHQMVIARRVVQSHREIPPINLTCQMDMSAVIAYRRRSERENMRKLSFDAFFVFAAARTMVAAPRFRSFLRGETVMLYDAIDVGVAISIGDDLFTPVIRRADTKSILEIDTEVQQAIDRVKRRLVQPADMAGAGMTISNLGMYPVRSFAAVIPPDQSAVLAIGSTEETPVVRNGNVKIVPLALITLSVDHRLINGREAGQFLAQLKERVEKS